MHRLVELCIVILTPGLLVLLGASLMHTVGWYWNRWQKLQATHSPISTELLRSPGQSLRAQIHELSCDILGYVFGFLAIPLLAYSAHLTISHFMRWPETTARVASTVVIFAGFSLFVAVKFWRRLQEYKSFCLGLDGELATAEELNQLMLDGCRVFHDVPIRKGNVDHVVVSHSGVYAVNTKAYSKPKQGKDAAEVTVDYGANELRFVHRTLPIPTDQLEMEARLLSEELTSSVGTPVRVEPMLALPGWYIKERLGRGRVFVFNPKNPKRFFVQSRKAHEPEMVQRIAHQLEQKCRNVKPSFRESKEWKSE